jgi:hypothetical protein
MRTLAPSTLLLTVLLTASCQEEKGKDPQPAPAAPIQAATINVYFDAYATPSKPAETKSATLLATLPVGQLLSDRLTIHFDNSFNDRVTDEVDFIIPKGRQRAGIVGTYTISSQPDAAAGDVQASYLRPSNNGDMWLNFFSSNNNMVGGSLVITSYNATRRLISGTYTLIVKDMKDPYTFIGYNSAADTRRAGNVRVAGTFEEVPLH